MAAGWLLLTCVVAPALFWIGYFYWKDKFRPEPLTSLGVCYLAGFATAMLCIRGYEIAWMLGAQQPDILAETNRPAFLLYALLLIGPLEEAAKALPFFVIAVRLREFDEPVDGIVYAACIALGFASYENLFHLEGLSGSEAGMRAFASPVVHALVSSVWGFAWAWAKLHGKSWIYGFAAFVIAAGIHGIYDFLATEPGLNLGAAGLILALWIWQIWIIRRLEKRSQPRLAGDPVLPPD